MNSFVSGISHRSPDEVAKSICAISSYVPLSPSGAAVPSEEVPITLIIGLESVIFQEIKKVT